ncbi:DUF2259 domain-containing protein [Prosthecomicrobium pneumaticum]|uniref:Putative secreted protein n=1 Tax=Prosthecomicrobium pneumaticum TaxID=81895 RepID=A0A7W9FPH4_9HYPH|nr:DUF2259 domain-containing protein [Prosthecomicrobium pneumaticum]MBB5754489.1 putative secreted protein [Prosthecomicrobium pneumaticum]
MRAVLSAAVLALLAAWPARAGDIADRAFLGFSPDGSRFAFEEFGVQDGSGFPYASVFVIDTHADAWIPGSPVRVQLDQDGATVAEARKAAEEKASAILTGIVPGGRLVASSPVTELSSDPHHLRFVPRPAVPPIDQPLELAIEEYPLAVADAPEGQEIKGFRLTLSSNAGERLLHEDSEIPQSRGFPTEYRISDVVAYYPRSGRPVLVTLVMMLVYGFEGPDGRYIAVTTRL